MLILSPTPSFAQTIDYGGFLVVPVPCYNGIMMIILAVEGFLLVPMNPVYIPGVSRLNLAFNIVTPGTKQIAKITDGALCLVPPYEPIPSIGFITPYPLAGLGTSGL